MKITRSCRFEPTCGDYAREAIAKHGPWLGWLMGCERSIRYHGDTRTYRRAVIDGQTRLLDPVSDNDFWFPAPLARISHQPLVRNPGSSNSQPPNPK